MPGERGVSLPLAALSVVALFLSTALLGQRAFDLLRLGEGDADTSAQLAASPVESRLWEDPFAALARYRAKLKELCAPSPTGGVPDPRCGQGVRDEKTFNEELRQLQETGSLTVIAAMLPGAAFIGVEEARRRVRYAVLAGLNAEGYVPSDSEHMGLLRLPLCGGVEGCRPRPGRPIQPAVAAVDSETGSLRQAAPLPPPAVMTDIPFETLTTPRDRANRRRHVVVLWIEDTKLQPHWLSTLAALLGKLAPENSAVRILGPYKSDDLVRGLDDLAALADAPPDWQRRLARLGDLRLISPFSTAAAGQLRRAAKRDTFPSCTWRDAGKDCLDEAFKDRLTKLGIHLPADTRFFVRTIGTDRRQIEVLIRELCARGVASDAGGRVVLLSEWDSIYARTFAETLQDRLDARCNGDGKADIRFENYPYLRGLDGANVDGATKQVRLVPRGAGRSKDDSKDAAIEWPESRDQRDYVRRLVARIQQGVEWRRPETEVRAIGIIGTDVHDKLVLLQALRTAFADRVLFTTDLDARLLHPEVARYTRNLIVASSLPLALDIEVQGQVGPFRDIYQTATYLAARYAAASEDKQVALGRTIEQELAKKRLYEIGSDGEVELSIDHMSEHESGRRLAFAALAGVVLLGFGGFMLLWQPTASMKAALGRSSDGSPGGGESRFELSTAVLSGAQIAVLGFALGVVLELGFPGAVGPGRALLLGGAFTACFWAFRYPGVRDLSAGRPAVDLPTMRAWRIWQVVIRLLVIGLVFGLAWWLWLTPSEDDVREPFAPLSGVSAWPAQLVRTLALLLFVWFLDFAWTGGRLAAGKVGRDYFPMLPRVAAGVPAMDLPQRFIAALARRQAHLRRALRLLHRSPRTYLRASLRHARRGACEASLWFWSPPVKRADKRVDGQRLWRNYRNLLRNGPRLCRIVFWLVVAGLLVGMVYWLSEGVLPEIPARGLDDRELFSITTLATAVGTVILLVLVGDATVLTFRFILLLKGGRTTYPRATVERFAARLGTDPELHRIAIEPIAARIADRGNPAVMARNSLLDDWIDARLLADHTAAIAPLILAPFIVVALLLVARSAVFDNWAISGIVLVTLAGYLLWAIAMAALLNIGAEMARRKAVEGMRQDLLWLQGSGERYKPLAARFPDMIEQVRTLRRGAFAPFFEQPLVQAILVPLGGAGGVQLLELLLFARA